MSTTVLKDAALEEYYQALFQMYGSTGWIKLQEDFGRMMETHYSLGGIDTIEQLWFRKGQLDVMAQIVSHQATAEFAYNTQLAEQEGGEAEASTGGTAKVIS